MLDGIDEFMYYSNLLTDDKDDDPPWQGGMQLTLYLYNFFYAIQQNSMLIAFFFSYILSDIFASSLSWVIIDFLTGITMIYWLWILYFFKILQDRRNLCWQNSLWWLYDQLFFFASLWGVNKNCIKNRYIANYALFFSVCWLFDMLLGGNLLLQNAYNNLMYYHSITTGFFYQILFMYRECGLPVSDDTYTQCRSIIYFLDWFGPYSIALLTVYKNNAQKTSWDAHHAPACKSLVPQLIKISN